LKESVAVVGWLITFLAGVIAPAVILVLIGMTSNTLLRAGAAGRFVSANASAGGIFSPNLTTVQTTTGSIVISNTFSAPRNQPLVVRETLKDGLQLCAQGKPDTCAGLAGSWAGDMKPIPHARPRFAGLVRGIGSRGALLWLMMGIFLSIGAAGMVAQQVETPKRKGGSYVKNDGRFKDES
jgi:hypothetical protein